VNDLPPEKGQVGVWRRQQQQQRLTTDAMVLSLGNYHYIIASCECYRRVKGQGSLRDCLVTLHLANNPMPVWMGVVTLDIISLSTLTLVRFLFSLSFWSFCLFVFVCFCCHSIRSPPRSF
jgi:hypothetical protein